MSEHDPNPKRTGVVFIRMPQSLKIEIGKLARLNGKSTNQFCVDHFTELVAKPRLIPLTQVDLATGESFSAITTFPRKQPGEL